jgi:SAM-dependent methyltransferase
MADLDQLLIEAAAIPTEGWDFSRLGGRLNASPRPWDFSETVSLHAANASAMLDMGTGGGEWLAALSCRPPRTVATESWPPNANVARRRLLPLGITVVQTGGAPDNTAQSPDEPSGHLPFPSASFDIVCNRHESYLAAEVARVLAKDGVFLTQQTGGDYSEFYDLLELHPPPRQAPEWNLQFASDQLRLVGLHVVDGAEAFETVAFADIGAVVWYLRAIPWVVVGFSISEHRGQLKRLHERIEANGPVSARQPTFWLKAVKR